MKVGIPYTAEAMHAARSGRLDYTISQAHAYEHSLNSATTTSFSSSEMESEWTLPLTVNPVTNIDDPENGLTHGSQKMSYCQL